MPIDDDEIDEIDEINDDIDKITQVMKDLPINKNYPSRELHTTRNDYNTWPENCLISKFNGVFTDTNGKVWHQMPWYWNMFHNPAKNVKLVSYDCNDIEGAPGSSEIIVQNQESRYATMVEPKYHHKMFCAVATISVISLSLVNGNIS